MENIKYNEFGNMITRRTRKMNNDYHRNVVGQCIYWYKKNQQKNDKPIRLNDKKSHEYFHNKFKQNVLIPIFGLNSTTKLTTEQMPEFIAECFIFLSGEIDVFEYGEMPSKKKKLNFKELK